MGFSNIVKSDWNSGLFLRPLTAPDIISIPVIRMVKPSRITPTSFFLPRLTNIIRQIPIRASIGTQESGLSHAIASATSAPSPPTPERAVSHAVTAVPTFAPMITPTA